MGRRPRVFSPVHSYHLTARCINRDWFRLPIETVWEIFGDYLFFVHHAYGLKIIAFVLMNNHFHLIAKAPRGNLSECMWRLMTDTSREITRLSGRTNQTYGGPFHPCLLDSQIYFENAYRYLYRNPVEAGLCSKVEDYPYSTLSGLLGRQKLVIPVKDKRLFENVELNLAWMNTPYGEREKDAISKALKKAKFELSVDRKTRKPFDALLLPKSAAHL